MADFIYRKTEEELQRARRLVRIAGRIALGSILLFVLILLVGFILHRVFLPQMPRVFDFAPLVLPGGLFLAAGLWLIGASASRQDHEVRTHTGNDPIVNPLSGGMRTYGWLLIAFSIAAVWAGFYLIRQGHNASDQAQFEHESAIKKWVDEEVAYLITPEEKQAYLILKSDAERERFIERFWRDRSSKAGLDPKTYRTEHDSRFNGSNVNFRIGDIPGWKTARGHIYILLGKSETTRALPGGEAWFYRNAPGFGTNVWIQFTDDSDPNGFRLMKKPESR